MKKVVIVLAALFELVFYTFLMVLVGSVEITNQVLDLIVHFLSLALVAFVFYILIRFIFMKLDMKGKRYIYYVVIANIVIGAIAPVILIIIIPSEILTTIAFLVLVSTFYYGLFINFGVCVLNQILTNRQKKLG